MWTPTTRRQHSRIVTRYQTDLTDAESARDRAAIAAAHRDRQAAPAADARDLELHPTGIKSAAVAALFAQLRDFIERRAIHDAPLWRSAKA